MKILVVSLLRIGDIVLSAPALRGLREKNPEAEIHLLINRQFSGVMPLMPYINHVHHFDRTRLQEGLGQATVPFFDSYERLTSLLDTLNGERFDLIVNLTHSRLSGWVVSLIDAPTKLGLSFDGTGRPSFGSNWFRYLNNQVDAESTEAFHFTDVFRFALGLDDEVHLPALIETEAGRAEALEAIAGLNRGALSASGGGAGEIVVVQALTSDKKKDWGLERYTDAVAKFAESHRAAKIAFVGAPFERETLAPAVERLQKRGVSASLVILTFEGAFSFLLRSKLLLTGDTSIKHLACAARIPVIELSVGSSDCHRTGAYMNGSIIIQSREACAPCSHSKACHRESHACAEAIPVEVVAMVAGEIFAGRAFQLKTIAEEYKGEAEILRVQSRTSGFWAAYSVLEPFTEEAVGRWIDLASRKLWLQSIQGADPLNRGSEVRRLAELLKAMHPRETGLEWRHLLGDFERQLMEVEGRVNGFKVSLRALHGSYENPKKMAEYIHGLIAFRDRMKHSAILDSFRSTLDQIIEDDISPPFVRLRRIVDVIGEIDRRARIGLEIVRGLASNFSQNKEMDQT